MSRNVVRQRQPSTPVKVKKRTASDTSSSLDLSDEEGYSGVEEISDSDEDEEDVDAVEEEYIRTDEWRHNVANSPPRPVDENDLGDDEEEDGDDDDAAESWDGFDSDSDEVLPTSQAAEETSVSGPEDMVTQRRVRFDVPESSDGDSTETDDDHDHGFFPDIFVDQSTLDPAFRREIEHDPDDDNSSNSGFWDFHGHGEPSFEELPADIDVVIQAFEDDDSTPVATPLTNQGSATAVSTPLGSPEAEDTLLEGFSSDGDTTDEEDPPERPPRCKTPKEKADASSDSDAVALIKPRRGQPRIGRFNLDSTSKKPVAIVNPRTGKMLIFTPHRTRGRGFDLSPEQFNMQWFGPEAFTSPMVNSGSVMMSGMVAGSTMVSSNTFGDFMNTQAVGPEEAFFSLPNGAVFEESSGDDDGVMDDEKNLALDDFITFDDFEPSSDEEKDDDNDDMDDPMLQTPARPNTASSDVTSLLDHFENNANIVGAFRRDQANHQLISRSKATRESLAFSGPYYEGTLRGIKDGRLATTNVPISPLRKQRKMPDMASSPLSSAAQKRKASSEQQYGHKRQRSIPDVNLLSI
jgi:hypothetical protein